jgi:NRPS condensation-like uncharacterized protein
MTRSLDVSPIDLALHRLRAHGEMVIVMELDFAGRLDPQILARAADLLLDAEPILACRLVLDEQGPRWEPVAKARRNAFTITYRAADYETVRLNGLDATANVQATWCLWRRESGDRLLVKMTHEAGDGVSLQYLVSRMASIYSALCGNASHQPTRNLERRRDLGQLLSQIPRRARPRLLWDFAKFMTPRVARKSTHVLPLAPKSSGPWVAVTKRVPATQLRYVSQYGKTRGATLNDVFLAAAYRALANDGRWDGRSALCISITVDLRRWCHSAAASICNLASFEHPFLMRKLGSDFEQTLANVTALTRLRKKHQPGLAEALLLDMWLRSSYLGRRERPTLWQLVACVMSNEGRLDRAPITFGTQSPVSAHMLPPFFALPGVQICLSGYGGGLTMAVVTPQNGQAVIQRFLDAIVHELPAEP